ncbi:MAG: protein-L-isoaspartate(D-aspartate) O-methyltransferase [Anaerolineae bacterium]|nr:protein-L-isoaspartate(D-aspartate) O-methyltransferase [Anaerolineae bacterium]
MIFRDDLTEYDRARERMVQSQIEARGIKDPRVLEAMRQVPRHLFVPVDMRGSAYRDSPLPIGEGQTISQPYIVALMTEMLELSGEERVLEIGTGSGYQAAILSLLAREVYTVERLPSLAQRAEEVLRQLGYTNVHIRVGDGTLGWPEHAPYEAIIVTAASPEVPAPLLDQLADGGRLVAPVGPRWNQTLVRVRREGDRFHRERLTAVAFVPLVGKHGWREDDGLLRRVIG